MGFISSYLVVIFASFRRVLYYYHRIWWFYIVDSNITVCGWLEMMA
jgi:hypothetical protein